MKELAFEPLEGDFGSVYGMARRRKDASEKSDEKAERKQAWGAARHRQAEQPVAWAPPEVAEPGSIWVVRGAGAFSTSESEKTMLGFETSRCW
ncbi:hypothetical protein [Pelagicoccus sp. SDUM812003]|uniref:hypothetical protein n=1 Tax=Pelagicoccus sp. SDUM812003 TaxID=3041267 RepID=UPI00280DC03F|nr:hypothetical protein [Pelagicoccus sp. SDUM812003]MDQ8201902.1 hypothetical protein [Pelagicoccus sp. SDUM812003]